MYKGTYHGDPIMLSLASEGQTSNTFIISERISQSKVDDISYTLQNGYSYRVEPQFIYQAGVCLCLEKL